MRYNTGNAVEPDGSSDPRDLYDNAGIYDLLLNGPLGEYLSRLGIPLKSWRGIMQQVTDYLLAQGYEAAYLTYGAGVTVDRQTQLIQRDGEFYRVTNAADVPLVLTGTWATDSLKLQAIGDALLRLSLANSADSALGANLVARALRHINSLAELRTIRGKYDGEVIYLRGRTAAAIGLGAGNFVWIAASTAADDDGYTISATGTGRWVRQFATAEIDASWYGVSVSSSSGVNTPAIQAAVNAATSTGLNTVRLPGKGIIAAGVLTGVAAITFVSNGAFFADYAYPVEQDVVRKEVALPAAFSWLGGKFFTGGTPGTARTTLTVENLWKLQEVAGIINYYVDGVNGLDTNNGSVNAPFKTIAAAIAASSTGVVWVKAGTYYESLGNVIGVSVNRDIQIRTWSGGNDVKIRNAFDPAALTWSVDTGSTYKATVSSTVYRVLDMSLVDIYGDFKDLVPRTSIALVNANPGSYFYDTGTGILYVRRYTNSAPGNDILVPKASTNMQMNANRGLFLRGLIFEGGGGLRSVTDGTSRPRIYLQGVTIKYAANNGLEVLGGSAYLEDCIFAKSGLDNLNYHDSGSLASRAFEKNVISRSPGDTAAKGYLALGESQNASSMHDTGSVVRVNGVYDEAFGPVIADTGSSSSINIGLTIGKSLATTATQNTSIYSDGGMSLIDSVLNGSVYDIRVGSGGTVQVRESIMVGSILREGGGKVQQF